MRARARGRATPPCFCTPSCALGSPSCFCSPCSALGCPSCSCSSPSGCSCCCFCGGFLLPDLERGADLERGVGLGLASCAGGASGCSCCSCCRGCSCCCCSCAGGGAGSGWCCAPASDGAPPPAPSCCGCPCSCALSSFFLGGARLRGAMMGDAAEFFFLLHCLIDQVRELTKIFSPSNHTNSDQHGPALALWRVRLQCCPAEGNRAPLLWQCQPLRDGGELLFHSRLCLARVCVRVCGERRQREAYERWHTSSWPGLPP